MDGTHIAIVPPKSEGLYPEYIWVNRKICHSMNIQLVRITLLKLLDAEYIKCFFINLLLS